MKLRPGFFIVISFFIVILIGAVLLSLPISSASGRSTNFLDAYFTANSATCVTGLVLLDTGTYFSVFGLIVILVLIQIGGLGYMTFSVFMVLLLRKKMFVSERIIAQEALNIYSAKETTDILKKIFLIVLSVEGMGALLLFLRWLPEMGVGQGFLFAVFHAVSAFNNAGFALPAKFASMTPYVADLTVNLIITTLVIIGGIGFIVLNELLSRKKLSLHSKIVLSTTGLLLLFGTVSFLLIEFRNPGTIGGLSFPHKIMASYFQSVTSRTAGFNTINNNALYPASLIVTMFLMFIGASPGGTGGGVKTSTAAAIGLTLWSTLKSAKDTVVFRRRIPHETVRKAFTITTLACMAVIFAVLLLQHFTNFTLMESAFEVISAFGTVGLSMGITPKLPDIGKLIIICVMFLGRVGPLTFAISLMLKEREPRVEYPKEQISIG